MPPARLFLIDGSNQMYRAYHALPGMSGPDGRATNAIYGVVTMVRKLMTDLQPQFIAAAFDLKGPTFRSEMSADYKANRAPMPPDLAEQIPLVHEALQALGIPILTFERYEADDVIGTLALRAVDAGFDAVIVTGDKDFFQLVDDRVKVYNPRDEGTWFDADGVVTKFGVRPDQVIDVLALMGDSIDNVKGVPGIGEKGARELIATHGSVEALLADPAAIAQKRYRTALVTHAESARQSKELVRIHTDVPVEFELDKCRYAGVDRARCFDLFTRLGFRSLVMEYAPTADSVQSDYAAVTSLDELRALVATLQEAGTVALHLITDSPVSMRSAIVGVALAHTAGHARYVPIGHTALDGSLSLDAAEALAVLKPLFEDPRVAKVGHDLKSATIVLQRHGIALNGRDTDTLLASYLIDATRSTYPLEDLALEELTYRAKTEEDLRGRGVKALPFNMVPIDAVTPFAAERVDLVMQLAPRFREGLVKAELDTVYRDLELPLIPVLVDIELAGVKVDAPVLQQQAARLERELAERAERIYAMAGESFNINSPKQLGEILFEKMKLPALKRTGKAKTASTAADVLEELALSHDMPREILEWRALQKLKGTYVDALPQLIHPKTGRVHTSFNQATAATGRLSSSDPNLQNVPIRTEIGREIRRAFIAEAGHVLISADYSQIELRVLAHLSEDQSLVQAFQHGEDIHDRTALKVFGTDSGLSVHELRRRAKIINYALLYGKTAFTLSKDIGVTQQAAQEFIDAYFAGFPEVRTFLDRTLEDARRTGLVKTMFGRRRLVPDINSRNGQTRSAAERISVNMPIQGTAADVLKRAMIDLHEALTKGGAAAHTGARMILTVHDELLFEVKKEAADETVAVVKDRMERAVTLNVPLTVDVGVGENWKEAKE